MDVVGVSPSERNPCGKFIGIGQKKIIINLYKDKLKQQLEDPDSPRLTSKKMIVDISKSSGIGQRTIQTTLSEYKNQGTISTPNRKKTRPTVLQKIDECVKNAIRKKIHDFWRNHEVPTILKILTAINEDETLPNLKRSSFQKVLKDLQFEYVKKNRNSILIEKEDLITWRRSYLDKIRHYRAQNKCIYYLDEMWIDVRETLNRTWFNTTDGLSRDTFLGDLTTTPKEPPGEAKRLIVLHIGSTNGFVPGGLMCFEFRNNSLDFRDQINGDIFHDWFAKILPLLKDNSVVVMDNAIYHSVKKFQIPTMSWKKQDIVEWLENKGEIVNILEVKIDLMKKVRKLKKQYDKYVIDEFAIDNNKVVLRLPPYHCELNPIELAWASIKNYVRIHNNTSQLNDVLELLQKAINQVTPRMWTNFVEHVIKEEEKLLNIEHITDELMDRQPEEGGRHILTIGSGDTSFSDSDKD